MIRDYPKKFEMPEQKEMIDYLNSIEINGYYKKIKNGVICAIDQKNTYDLLNVVSKCLLIMSKNKKDFFIKDFLENEYCKNILREKTYDNGKAVLRNETLKEYDKIFGNTLETLAYTDILEKKYIGKSRSFSIKNFYILEKLANSELASLAFLSHFIFLLVKNDKEIFDNINKLLENPYNNNYKNNFKHSTVTWLKNNSNRNADSTQICKKIDNYLFYIFDLNKYKSNKNNKHLKQSIKDLSYFRVHVRDKNKVFLLTRKENINFDDSKIKKNFNYNEVKDKIISLNKKINKSTLPCSEVKIYEPYILKSYNVHHILPKSFWYEKDMISSIEPDMPENLIIMNQSEHYDYAHNHGDTKSINENNLIDILQKQYEKILVYIKEGYETYNLKRFYLLLCKIFDFQIDNDITNNEFIKRNIEDILYE